MLLRDRGILSINLDKVSKPQGKPHTPKKTGCFRHIQNAQLFPSLLSICGYHLGILSRLAHDTSVKSEGSTDFQASKSYYIRYLLIFDDICWQMMMTMVMILVTMTTMRMRMTTMTMTMTITTTMGTMLILMMTAIQAMINDNDNDSYIYIDLITRIMLIMLVIKWLTTYDDGWQHMTIMIILLPTHITVSRPWGSWRTFGPGVTITIHGDVATSQSGSCGAVLSEPKKKICM